MSPYGLRQRLVRGARAQVFGHAVRVLIQVGSVSIFTSTWGLHLYGEWLILAAVPLFLAFSDVGFVTAAVNEMIMAVGRDDRPQALAVFQVVSRVLLAVFAILAIALPTIAVIVPLTSLLQLSAINEFTAGWMVVALGLDALLVIYASLLYGGYACEGRYGEGAFAIAAIALVEFCALAATILGGGGPALAATAMLGGRLLGTLGMYVVLRRRAPWLRFGKRVGARGLLRSLLSPALASGAFPVSFALNVQGMVVMIGVVAGPVSVAVFSTLRTLSRAVIQLLASVNTVVSPEISKAFGAGDADLLRRLHRRGCQVAVWSAATLVILLAVFGGPILHLWTSGKVGTSGSLLYLFLAVTLIDAFWYASVAILIATNRHQRVAADYLVACLVTVPVAYVLLEAMGLSGAALSLILLEVFMGVSVLRRTLPAAQDSLLGLMRAIRTPPLYVLGGLVGMERRTRSASP